MNDVSTPTLPAVPPSSSNRNLRQDSTDDVTPISSDPSRNRASRKKRSSLSKAAKDGLTKKLQFLNHLSSSLDTLVFAELCVLYYMDCSFFRLFIRWIAQSLFISPRAEDSILIVPNYHVTAITGPNFFCILLHLLTALPSASEASRGYLHGGALVDFIGQKAPTSKFNLFLLDVLIFGLQCFMLTVNMEKDKIRKIIKPPKAGTTVLPGDLNIHPGQDHDAEERGVLRNAPDADETNDIEMRSLGNNQSEGDGNSDQATGLLEGNRDGNEAGDYEGLLDTLRSGNSELANFRIPYTLRTAWTRANTPESATAYAIQTAGYNATLSAIAQRRARFAATTQQPPV